MEYKLLPDVILHDRYQVKKVLSEARIHGVFLARDIKITEKLWIVKEYIPPGEDVLKKEELESREAQLYETLETITNFDHPSLPKILDFFQDAKRHYIVMEQIEGISVQSILDMSVDPLKEEQILGWALQIADALSYLHTRPKPYVHTHLDPAHIMIDADSKIKLVNLGLNRFLDPAQVPKAFSTSPYDIIDDFFELGKTLYYCFTRKDFNVKEIIINVPGASEKANKLIQRLLSDDPSRNYRDAQELTRDLDKILHPIARAEVTEDRKGSAYIPFYMRLIPSKENIDSFIYAVLSQKLVYFVLEIVALILLLVVMWAIRHPGWNYTKKSPVVICVCRDEIWTFDATTEKLLSRNSIQGVIKGVENNRNGTVVYLSNYTGSAILVMDTLHNVITKTIPVDKNPSRLLLYEPNLFCINESTNNISLVNVREQEMNSIVPTGDRPVDIAFSSQRGLLFISDSAIATLHIIDPITNKTKDMIKMEGRIGPLALSIDEKYIYAANERPAGLTILDTETLKSVNELILPELQRISSMQLSPDGEKLYLIDRDSFNLAIYSIAEKKIESTIKVGKYPVDLTITGEGKIWIANFGSHNICVVDPKMRYVDSFLPVGRNPDIIRYIP